MHLSMAPGLYWPRTYAITLVLDTHLPGQYTPAYLHFLSEKFCMNHSLAILFWYYFNKSITCHAVSREEILVPTSGALISVSCNGGGGTLPDCHHWTDRNHTFYAESCDLERTCLGPVASLAVRDCNTLPALV